MPLNDQQRQKLDGIVAQMSQNGENEQSIQAVVNDFKQKYATADAYAAPKLPESLSWLQPVVDFANSGANEGMRHVANVLSLLPGQYGESFKKIAAEIPQAQTGAEKAGSGVEGALEYLAPTEAVSAATKAAPLAARVAAQGAVNAGIAGAQSNFNPMTIAVGGALGAGGEAIPAAADAAKSLSKAAPDLENYAKSFAAVPTQKTVIGRALPTLVKDGIAPGVSTPEMQDAVKSQLGKLSEQYEQLKGLGIENRQIDPASVVKDLQRLQSAYQRGGVVSSANKPYFNKLEEEIEDVKKLADQNGGKLTFDDLRYLRDGANGRTNFASPDAEQSLYKSVGNAYRTAMDKLAPETTDLNRDWATYKSLEKIVDKNVSYGRGVTESGLDRAIRKGSQHAVGSAIGATVGHASGVPGGSWLGAVAGGALYPKLAEPVAMALRNAAKAGNLNQIPNAARMALDTAARMGDGKTVMKILGAVSKEATTSAVSQ